MVPRALFTALTLAALTACGPSGDPDANLKQARMDIAAENYDAALDGLTAVLGSEAAASKKYQAMRLAVVCDAYVLDREDKARSARLESLTAEYAEKLSPDEVVKLGLQLTNAQASDLANKLIEWGLATHPASKEAFDVVAKEAAKSATSAELEALESMGYLGGDDEDE